MCFLALFKQIKSFKVQFFTAHPKELTYAGHVGFNKKDCACSVFLVTRPPSTGVPDSFCYLFLKFFLTFTLS